MNKESLAVRSATLGLLLAALALSQAACNRNPFVGQQPFAWQQAQPQPGQPLPEQVAQLQDLNRRNAQLDANNSDLHRQLAQAQQQQQLLGQQLDLLRKQLQDTTALAREAETARQEAEKKFQAQLASTRQRGGATITANNSLTGELKKIELPGVEVRSEDDVIRIELPADQLFQPTTAQFTTGAPALLAQVSAAVRQQYPRQKIVIESHTDSAPIGGGTMSSKHRLTAAQAMAVFDQLTTTYGMPQRQLTAMAHGDNHPLASNATPAGQAKNRRIEIVIYPETVD
jgi:flagellar motor protein MotB